MLEVLKGNKEIQDIRKQVEIIYLLMVKVTEKTKSLTQACLQFSEKSNSTKEELFFTETLLLTTNSIQTNFFHSKVL